MRDYVYVTSQYKGLGIGVTQKNPRCEKHGYEDLKLGQNKKRNFFYVFGILVYWLTYLYIYIIIDIYIYDERLVWGSLRLAPINF